MGQPGMPLQQMGHIYTAEEVRMRLNMAQRDGELMKDARGLYHAVGHSGTVWPHAGNPALESKIIKPAKSYSAERLREHMEKLHTGPNMYPITVIDQPDQPRRRFSVRAFIREGIKDLKSFFKPSDKKEIEHGK